MLRLQPSIGVLPLDIFDFPSLDSLHTPQLTAFVAVLTMDANRQKTGRLSFCCCFKSKTFLEEVRINGGAFESYFSLHISLYFVDVAMSHLRRELIKADLHILLLLPRFSILLHSSSKRGSRKLPLPPQRLYPRDKERARLKADDTRNYMSSGPSGGES